MSSFKAYYNENDPFAAQWLRGLIKAGHIAPGIVDERSIEDVQPDEISEYTQCHFFAGIGGWSLALRNAGWPDDRPIWTGSCPCQPFSAAGKGSGFDDERHLWPSFHWLIRQCAPTVVAGEQVSSKAAGPWIDLVQADLEALGYAFGCVAFPAASVGAPHMRDRAYWMGHRSGEGLEGFTGTVAGGEGRTQQDRPAAQAGSAGELADSERIGREVEIQQHAAGASASGLGKADVSGGDCASNGTGPTNGEWRTADWLHCRDGKWRPVEPGTFPLVNELPNRVGLLRGYGNAIVPAQAAEFMMAARDYLAQEKAIEIVGGLNA